MKALSVEFTILYFQSFIFWHNLNKNVIEKGLMCHFVIALFS